MQYVLRMRCTRILDRNGKTESERESERLKGQPSSLLSLLRECMSERMHRRAGPHFSAPFYHDDVDDDVRRNEREEKWKKLPTHVLVKLHR